MLSPRVAAVRFTLRAFELGIDCLSRLSLPSSAYLNVSR